MLMKFLENIILSLLIILTTQLVKPVGVLAAGACGGYFYGGPCVTAEILLDKLVKDPVTEIFVDNLGPTDNKFNPEQEVIFKIIVKNTSSVDLSSVKIKDILPDYIDFTSIFPQEVNWDKESKTLTFNIGNLQAGESREYELKVKVVAKDQLPADQSLVCVTNWAEAKSGEAVDSDSAGLCIQNVSILPPTGPSSLVMTAILALGATGLILIRRNCLA